MKRIALAIMPALGLVAALTLPSAACSANPAAASPAAAAMSAGTNPLPPAPAGYHKVGLTWVLQNVVGETFGPTQRTGYGKGRITGLSKGCPECSWYRVNIAYSDQQPTAAQQGLERPTTQRLRDFCWPWENYIGSGCAGWNSAWTWNWSDIWHTINGDWHPWDPQTTIDRVQNCIGGITEHITVFVLGPHAAASVFEGFGEVELTPGGAAYAAGASCAVGIVK